MGVNISSTQQAIESPLAEVDGARANGHRTSVRTATRVAYETTLVQFNRTGGGRATRELAKSMRDLEGVELIEIGQPAARSPLLGGRIPRGLARELSWLPYGLARAARVAGADLIHLPAPLSPPLTRTPVVMTVHDTYPWERPEWCSRSLAIQHRLRVRPSLARMACVIVPSNFTAERVCEVLGADPRLVRVVPHGISAVFRPDEPGEPVSAARPPYVLGQWSTVPRKNVVGLVACFERLAAAGAPHELILFGDEGAPDRDLVARLERSPVADRIRRTGWVAEGDLARLYRGADAFVFPTLGEGFGFPPLEAMACGTPVVSTTAGSISEVTGDAAVLVEPGSVESLTAATLELLESPGRREELRAAGLRRAGEFSWSRAAKLTGDAYELALELAG